MASSIELYLLAAARPSPWTLLTLQNSWVNAGGSDVNTKCRLWPLMNETEVAGIIKNGTVTSGTLLFTLPSGMAPASVQTADAVIISGTGAGTTAAEIVIHTDGTVNIGVATLTGVTAMGFHFFVALDA